VVWARAKAVIPWHRLVDKPKTTTTVRTCNHGRTRSSRRGEEFEEVGYASLPQFSAGGKKLYYLLRTRDSRRYEGGELGFANLETGKRERLLPDFLLEYLKMPRVLPA
jgi:hypothetical protein